MFARPNAFVIINLVVTVRPGSSPHLSTSPLLCSSLLSSPFLPPSAYCLLTSPLSSSPLLSYALLFFPLFSIYRLTASPRLFSSFLSSALLSSLLLSFSLPSSYRLPASRPSSPFLFSPLVMSSQYLSPKIYSCFSPPLPSTCRLLSSPLTISSPLLSSLLSKWSLLSSLLPSLVLCSILHCQPLISCQNTPALFSFSLSSPLLFLFTVVLFIHCLFSSYIHLSLPFNIPSPLHTSFYLFFRFPPTNLPHNCHPSVSVTIKGSSSSPFT